MIALISGITGQDGSYLSELLLNKNYEVHGIVRRTSGSNTDRLFKHLKKSGRSENDVILHDGDMTDATSLSRIVKDIKPDEVYNLAAQSHVAVSFKEPEYTADSDAVGTLRLLEAIRHHNLSDTTRFYQASTSELYGLTQCTPQDENTPFYPRSPYGVAKLYAYWITVNYRESYGMYSCNGILFNHESPLRGSTFVTKKITESLAKVKLGIIDSFSLGNLDARRDWGHARDYVYMQWLMLQQESPDDYVIATGKQCTVKDFVVASTRCLDMKIEWFGSGIKERAVCVNSPFKDEHTILQVDEKYFRPSEVDSLVGDASKAKRKLGWSPKTSFEELVYEMTVSDLEHYELQCRFES